MWTQFYEYRIFVEVYQRKQQKEIILHMALISLKDESDNALVQVNEGRK